MVVHGNGLIELVMVVHGTGLIEVVSTPESARKYIFQSYSSISNLHV